MIADVGRSLRQLLLEEIDELTSELQIGFAPPDDAWRSFVATLTDGSGAPANAVNVYLADLRENTRLRSNQRVRQRNEDGFVEERAASRRLDCHYLVTTWSPASVTPPIEPTLDEHALMHRVTAVLLTREALVPTAIFGGSLPPGFSPDLADAVLPVSVAPESGFPSYGEFWGTMGTDARWRPALYLIVTVPMPRETRVAGPPVTTRILRAHAGDPHHPDIRIQIGGWLRDGTVPPGPDGLAPAVAGAWVALESSTGRRLTTTTDAQGRFTFRELSPGSFTLRAATPQHGEITTTTDVPSPGGGYDLIFT
jgi:hypothetical protein